MTRPRTQRTIKPGSRPTKANWCSWLLAMAQWTPEERGMAHDKAEDAYCSRSTRAQYAALGEMRAISKVNDGTFVHRHHCADRACAERNPQQQQKAEE